MSKLKRITNKLTGQKKLVVLKECSGCDRKQFSINDTFSKFNGKYYCRRCFDEIQATTCTHDSSSLEYVRELDYECQGRIKILVKDVCNKCGKKLGNEVHVFKYSYTEDCEDV